jgi:plastocyanin
MLLSAVHSKAETVGYWRFEEKTSGNVSATGTGGAVPNTVLDSSGKGNHMQTWTTATAPTHTPSVPFPSGTLAGIPATGALNTASLDFRGSPVDIYSGSNSSSKPINSKTFTAWTVEASFCLDVTGRWQVIVGKDGNPIGGQPPLSLKVRADNTVEIGIVDGSGVGRWCVGSTKIEAGKWYQAAATATGSELALWIKPEGCRDYIAQGSVPIQGAFFNTYSAFNQPWIIGRGMWNGAQKDATDGRIDEVRISDTALTPGQFLGNYAAADSDADNLPDTWELVHFRATATETDAEILAKQSSLTADPDGDGYSNRVELRSGTNPAVADNLTGKLTRQVWLKIPGPNVADLINSPRFYGKADITTLNDGISTPRDVAENYGQRLQGWLTAPVTGDYTFWVAGDNQCELWLSTNQSKFNKQLIASVPVWTAPDEWDKFPAQKSATVSLVAGQKYFIECLHKEATLLDSLSVAWQAPGEARQVIPAQHFEPYLDDSEDTDLDGLPDTWELQYGFSVSEDGAFDLAQSSMGDLDGDGFTNAFEAYLGENPRVAEGLVGYWERCVWTGLAGNDMAAFKNSDRFYQAPSSKEWVDSLDAPPSVGGDNCGYRFRGLITPTVSGTYEFRAAGDDSFEVWVSPNASKFNRRLIAWSQFWTKLNQYTAYPNQQGKIELQAGQPCYVEIFVRQRTGDSYVSLQWKAPSGAFTDIPAAQLRSSISTAEDPDDDDLSTDWELAHGFDPNAKQSGNFSPLADPDGDRVANREECLGGGNPFLKDSSRGAWVRERWNSMPYYSVLDTVQATPFFGPANSVETLQSGGGKTIFGTYFATRTRGQIIAPVTGKYRFWVSGGASVELWLAPDGKPFAKRRIARLGPEVGIGQGISYASQPNYDLYTSQQSVEIELQAGQAYFIELIQQTGHQPDPELAIAWAHDGGERTAIPFESLASYAPGNDDQDDDALPDAWETTAGLSPQDNGLTDRARQGERGDYDGDGLNNREEYLASTNPCDKDSDDDGISDAEEVKNLNTNPLAHNSAGEETVQSVNIHAPVGGSMNWSSFADGVVGERFRGSIEFDLNVPEAGLNWLVAIKGKILGQTSQTDVMPLQVSLDGVNLGNHDFVSSLNEAATLRVLTPRLTQGTHRIKIFVANMVARKSFLLLGVDLRRPTGADLDADGLPDWLAGFLNGNSWSAPANVVTAVSPYFLEGGSRFNGNLGLMANGVSLATTTGTTQQTWFANAPLSATGDTILTGVFEGGDDIRTTQVSWSPALVGQASRIDLRTGDTLKFHFPQNSADEALVTYTMQPATWSVQASASTSQTYTFQNPGTFTLRAVHASGATANTTVVVHKATASGDVVLGSERARILDFTGVPYGLKLEVAEPLRYSQKSQLTPSGGTRLRLECYEQGDYGLLARLPEGGPVVAKLPVRVTAYAGATSGQYQLVGQSTVDGYLTVSVPLVLAGLPDGYTVRVKIVRAGVLFENGTTTLNLTTADFIDGQYMLRFLYPETMQGGYCHYVEVLNPQGQVIANY